MRTETNITQFLDGLTAEYDCIVIMEEVKC